MKYKKVQFGVSVLLFSSFEVEKTKGWKNPRQLERFLRDQKYFSLCLVFSYSIRSHVTTKKSLYMCPPREFCIVSCLGFGDAMATNVTFFMRNLLLLFNSGMNFLSHGVVTIVHCSFFTIVMVAFPSIEKTSQFHHIRCWRVLSINTIKSHIHQFTSALKFNYECGEMQQFLIICIS